MESYCGSLIFPVGLLLVQRGIDVDPNCKRCGTPESVLPVLRDCPFSIKVWSLTSISDPFPSQGDIFSFLSTLKILKTLTPAGVTLAALYSWIL